MTGRYILIKFRIMILLISMKLGMAERQSKPVQKFLIILRLTDFFNSSPSLREIGFAICFGTPVMDPVAA